MDSSEALRSARPAKFSYPCWICGVKIEVGTQQIYDKDRPKGEMNCHATCFKEQNGLEETNTPPPTPSLDGNWEQVIQGYLAQPEFSSTLNIVKFQSVVYVCLVQYVKKVLDTFDFETDMERGVTKHDICERFLTKQFVFDIASEIATLQRNSSAELVGNAYSSCACSRGAGIGDSFHKLPTAVEDEVEYNGQTKNLTSSLFFTNQILKPKNIRLVPKCTIHGVVCNETTFECKQCSETKLFNSQDLINRGLLQ